MQNNAEEAMSKALLESVQTQLRRQFLLIEKEQQEKLKFKKDIELNVKNYYQTNLKPQCFINDKNYFDNSFNFVKQIIVNITKDVNIGLHICRECIKRPAKSYSEGRSEAKWDDQKLVALVLGNFYQTITVKNASDKNITLLVYKLLLGYPTATQTYAQNIQRVFDQYMQRQTIRLYFAGLAKETLKNVIALLSDNMVYHSLIQGSCMEDERDILQVVSKKSSISADEVTLIIKNYQPNKALQRSKSIIASKFLKKIYEEIDLLPSEVKIVLNAIYQSCPKDSKKACQLMWRLLKNHFLRPFQEFRDKDFCQNEAAKASMDIIISMIAKELLIRDEGGIQKHKIIKDSNQMAIETNTESKAAKHMCRILAQRLVYTKGSKFTNWISNTDKKYINSMIGIYGTCLSHQELKGLLWFLHSNIEVIETLNERVANRVRKVFQMSNNLQFQVAIPDSKHQHILLFEMHEDIFIQRDYIKSYSKIYEDRPVMKILRQSLLELQPRLLKSTVKEMGMNSSNLIQAYQKEFRGQDQQPANTKFLRELQKHCEKECQKELSQMLEKVIEKFQKSMRREQFQNQYRANTQMLIRLKYLCHLLKGEKHQLLLLLTLLIDSITNNCHSIRLYQQTKFYLLEIYSNIRDARLTLKLNSNQKAYLTLRSELSRIASKMPLMLCITSPSCRTHGDFSKYRMPNSKEIIIENIAECIHINNSFMESIQHSCSVQEAIHIFATLKEVQKAIHQPEFLSKINPLADSQFFATKIKESLQRLHKLICKSFSTQNSNSNQKEFEQVLWDIIYRGLHEQLVCSKLLCPEKEVREKISQLQLSYKDLQLSERLEEIIQGRQQKQCLVIKMKKDNLLNFNVILEVASKMLRSLVRFSKPEAKVSVLTEIEEYFRIVLANEELRSLNLTNSQMIFRTILKAKPPNLVSNLAYIEVFLSEKKLLKTKGKILKQFTQIVRKIYTLDIETLIGQKLHDVLRQDAKHPSYYPREIRPHSRN